MEKKNSNKERRKKSGFFRLRKMIKKELHLLGMDPINLIIAIVLPPLIITLFAFMLNYAADIPPVKCVVVSYDSNAFVDPINNTIHTDDSFTIPYLEAVNQSEKLTLVGFLNASEEPYAMEQARTMLLYGEINVIIAIPVDFSELISNQLPALLEAVPDSSEITSIQSNLNAVFDSIQIFIEENGLTPQYILEGYQEFEIPASYSLKYNFNITTTLSFITFGISMVLTILVVVQEKPIARLLLTPAKRVEILLAKYITYTLVLVIQVALILLATMLNGLYLVGSLFNLFFALFMVGFCGMSLGIFISCLSKTKTEANQLFFALFIIIVILSGIFIPIDSMPRVLQIFAYILPLSHGDPMLRSIITKGGSFFGIDFLSLLGLSAVLIGVSFILIIRRRYEV